MAFPIDDRHSQTEDILRRLVRDPRFTPELGEKICREGGIDRAILALKKEFFHSTAPEPSRRGGSPYRDGLSTGMTDNPFVQTASEQIETLKCAVREEGWSIPAKTFARLARLAPSWPKGHDSYRSFRIRFSKGDKGVAETFEAHVARIRHVFDGMKIRRWDHLRSDARHLRLYSGNAFHMPTVEWIIVHLDADGRLSDTERNTGHSRRLADEGLVMAWLFPKRARIIDRGTWHGWSCANYELNVPEYDDSSWRSWPCVDGLPDADGLHLSASLAHGIDSGLSVPTLQTW